MTTQLEKFKEAFARGLSFEEAAECASLYPCEVLVEYWNILVMERAVKASSAYFDRLMELAA